MATTRRSFLKAAGAVALAGSVPRRGAAAEAPRSEGSGPRAGRHPLHRHARGGHQREAARPAGLAQARRQGRLRDREARAPRVRAGDAGGL